MKTIVHRSTSRVGKTTTDTFQHKGPELIEIELKGEDIPFIDESIEGQHVTTVTLRKGGKAARFFLRVGIHEGYPFASIHALRRDKDRNTSREIVGRWDEELEQDIAKQSEEA